MNKIAFLVFLSYILASAAVVSAQEEAPAYSFGTMQAEKNIAVEPGETYTANLYFYNIYGNRITHVTLSIGEAPPGWDIKIEPELHTETVRVYGILTNVTENLYLEPMSPVPEKPDPIPEGMEYIEASGIEGYIPAKVAKVIITVPKDTPLGQTYTVRVDALASWLGQVGTVILSQQRSFDYTITTVTREYTEEIIPRVEEEKPVEEKVTVEKPITPWKYIVVGMIAGIVILACIMGVVYFVRKKM